jgi:hypothetical protein
VNIIFLQPEKCKRDYYESSDEKRELTSGAGPKEYTLHMIHQQFVGHYEQVLMRISKVLI